jgi:hypothetical protein
MAARVRCCEGDGPGYLGFLPVTRFSRETTFKMALHRDIYWVGRQWAVTGQGMQAIDQKLQGKFDIDVSRLWEDDLPESLRAEKWFNPEDFSKGLVLARARYPQPPGQPAPAQKIAPVQKSAPPASDSGPVEPPKPVLQKFHMRIESCPAKFVRPWRVRLRRDGIATERDN